MRRIKFDGNATYKFGCAGTTNARTILHTRNAEKVKICSIYRKSIS